MATLDVVMESPADEIEENVVDNNEFKVRRKVRFGMKEEEPIEEETEEETEAEHEPEKGISADFELESVLTNVAIEEQIYGDKVIDIAQLKAENIALM
ncbi:hypothetical protein RFI_09185 [Reticulomyxa filosa]|uniref:Uncharacterized protein n=1 Tax=Reticulomyxa filosa TaxID=46433 RepID=X6NQI0_RETFI|nr:hypothetical protein RFI_09185 [Reticulomyxa filosa]|eukprot:ETO27944.1 hypothetical protein RFI_09185 [Reticulomyxa filosa]